MSNGNLRVISILLAFIVALFIIASDNIFVFWIVTVVFSTVFIFILLNLISTIVPDISPIVTQSPISNGFSEAIAIPLNNLLTSSWAANAITTLPKPRPVIIPFRSYPNSDIIINPATI